MVHGIDHAIDFQRWDFWNRVVQDFTKSGNVRSQFSQDVHDIRYTAGRHIRRVPHQPDKLVDNASEAISGDATEIKLVTDLEDFFAQVDQIQNSFQ